MSINVQIIWQLAIWSYSVFKQKYGCHPSSHSAQGCTIRLMQFWWHKPNDLIFCVTWIIYRTQIQNYNLELKSLEVCFGIYEETLWWTRFESALHAVQSYGIAAWLLWWKVSELYQKRAINISWISQLILILQSQ